MIPYKQALFRELEFESRHSPRFLKACNQIPTYSQNLMAKTTLTVIGEPSAYSKSKTYLGVAEIYFIIRLLFLLAIAAGAHYITTIKEFQMNIDAKLVQVLKEKKDSYHNVIKVRMTKLENEWKMTKFLHLSLIHENFINLFLFIWF